MSDPVIEIDLGEEKRSDEERQAKEDQLSELARRVVPSIVVADLTRQAAVYADQSANIDDRTAAQLRVEQLETHGRGPAPDLSTRPSDRTLKRTVRQTRLREQLRSAPDRESMVLLGLADDFSNLWAGADKGKNLVELRSEPFGESLDELWREALARNARLRSPEAAQELADALNGAKFSPDTISSDLAQWRAALARGDADVQQILEAAAKLLGDLRIMDKALAPVMLPAEDLMRGVRQIAFTVERTLRQMRVGVPIGWQNDQSSAKDAAKRTIGLSDVATAPVHKIAESTELSIGRMQERLDVCIADIAKLKASRDALVDEDTQLQRERPSAGDARKAEIDAKLVANEKEAAYLQKKEDGVSEDVLLLKQTLARYNVSLKVALANVSAATSDLKSMLLRLQQSNSGMTPWRDAIADVRTAAQLLKPEERPAVLEPLQQLAVEFDNDFFSLREAITTGLDLGEVVMRTWRLAAQMSEAHFVIGRIATPAGTEGSIAVAAGKRTMLFTLAAMSETIGSLLRARVFMRGA